MSEAIIAFGSNLGDRENLIASAMIRLGGDGDVDVVATSQLYETAPWGDVNQGPYLNACALVETDLDPHALLARCLEVEAGLGRVRDPANRYGPRTIDLDIVLYDDLEIEDEQLTVPHPRLFERAFVLVPLLEIIDDATVSGRSLRQALDGLDSSGVRRLGAKSRD
jgi:2-amino-4-hydroxy-6-hydroxymethyldihydropteridine diphosphokinase